STRPRFSPISAAHRYKSRLCSMKPWLSATDRKPSREGACGAPPMGARMTKPLQGVKVVELASWTFVPAAGAVLADWGAEVIKVEHPESGDPQRGLEVGGIRNAAVSFMMEIANRGKRSVGINIAAEEGLEVLYKLVEQADVFLTNFLPEARARL